MSWFEKSSFAVLAKTALKEAQKKIDKVLDIQEDDRNGDQVEAEAETRKLTGYTVSVHEDTTGDCKNKPIDTEPHTFLKDVQVVCQPRAGDLCKEIETLTSVSKEDIRGRKRQSLASTLDSVDVLSPPQITPSSDEVADISESVELIEGSEITSGDSEINLVKATESIVIIGNSGAADIEGENDDSQHRTCSTVDSNSKCLLQSSDDSDSFEDIQLQSVRGSESNAQVTKQTRKNSRSGDTLSAYTSNDEMETATSSDIEIISNPNCDGSSTASTTTRTSPLKPEKEVDVATTRVNPLPNIVMRNKGHCREPSEISIISIDSPSEDEVEKLLKRISELNSAVEARELRLLQSEQHISELQERHTELLSLVNAETLQPSEEYTKRLSALEKKFQNCIRERDTLRTEIKELIPKKDLTDALAESQELRLEGEKLSKEILQQSNIIKKLRSKEKTTDMQLKTMRDQFASTSDEIERLKKTLFAKEDVERTQIEAVHKMSSENQRLCGKLDDTQQRLNTLQQSFDAVKNELQQRSKQHSDLSRTAESVQTAERDKIHAQAENHELQRQLNEFSEKLRLIELAAMKREQQLREENRSLMCRLEAAELRAETSTQEVSQTTIPLMRHLESLQQTLNQRTNNWNREEKCLMQKLEASHLRLQTLENIEETAKGKIDLLKSRCQESEDKLAHATMQEEKIKITMQLELKQKEIDYNRKMSEIIKQLEQSQLKIKTLEDSLNDAENKITDSAECLQRDQSTTSLTELQQSISDIAHRPPSPTVSAEINSLEDGMGGSCIDWQQDDLDCISNSRPAPGQHFGGFHYMSHNTTNFEYLQSMMKQKDGELNQFQWEVSRLQAERNALQEEISQLSIEFENIKDKLQTYELMEVNYNDLQTRYDALLQMYGEKVERCEELELDLKECKEAYKVQIQELLTKLRT